MKELRELLNSMAEPGYQKFASTLIPNIASEKLLGVRLPKLRKLAREIAGGDWRVYLKEASDDTFEEVMLQGMVIGCIKCDLEELFSWIDFFVPKIDNWSVCDSFCAGLKLTGNYRKEFFYYLDQYLEGGQEYGIRFGVVMLLNYFAEEGYIKAVLQRLDGIRHESYYVKLAVAWAVSVCFAACPHIVMDYLKDNHLDDFTYHKALQKITESLKVDKEIKVQIRSMKRILHSKDQ